jgi:hypothetical protein
MFRTQKLPTASAVQATAQASFRIENDFYPEAGVLRAQLEESLSRRDQAGVTPLSYVFSKNRFRFLTASAETLFTPDALRNLIETLANWGQNELGCAHVSTPQVRIFIGGCERSVLQDAVMLGWHYMLSLSQPGSPAKSERVQILIGNRFDGKNRLLGMCDMLESDLRSNRLIVHDTQDAYGIELHHHCMNPLEATVFLDGYFW